MNTPHSEPGPTPAHPAEGGAHGSPLAKVMASMTGAAAPEHDTGPPGADAVSVRAGHEPDAFEVRPILYVPAIVAVTLVVTYVFVTVVFSALRGEDTSADTNPQVEALNKPEFNERVGRISSTDPRPIDGKPGTVVPQPRLEFMREQAGGGPRDPSFYRSKREMQERNPPEIRPEYLRAENYVDPATGQRVLADYAFVGDKKDVIRVPIDDAIHMVEHGQLKLSVRKDPVKLAQTTEGAAKISNGGLVPPAGAATKDVAPHNEAGKPGH